jgi:high-affinity nickel permease
VLTSVLVLGFVLGMRHALEADHLAAVSALVSRKHNLGEMTRLGAIWGIGHTFALLVVSGAVILSPWQLPEAFWPALELTVGCILVGLGGQLLYRLWRDRVHVHAHHHDGGETHLHAHSIGLRLALLQSVELWF